MNNLKLKLNNVILAIFVLFNVVGGVNAFAVDRFVCRAQCVVVDPVHSTIESIGSAKGKSEINKDEAFDEMNQDCVNQSKDRGYGQNAMRYLVTHIKVSTDHMESKSEAESHDHRWQWLINYSWGSSTSNSTSTDQKFNYELDFADFSNCNPIESFPDGKPRYIGPDHPQG